MAVTSRLARGLPSWPLQAEAQAHLLEGDGHAAWDYPEDTDVAHAIEEVEIGYGA